MRLKEVIDKLQKVYNSHGDVDVEIVQVPDEVDAYSNIRRTVKDVIYVGTSVRLYNF